MTEEAVSNNAMNAHEHSSRARRWVPPAIGVTAVAAAALYFSVDRTPVVPWSVPLAVPMGITIIDVVTPSGQFLWQRLGDADGKPLYTYDADTAAGASSCTGECAKEFPPFSPGDTAQASGDWSIITREDGTRQWTYQGRPLHLYSQVDPPDAKSDGSPLGGSRAKDETLFDPGSARYSPKKGWTRAAFKPQAKMKIPAGIALRSNAVVNGYALVAADSGMMMYALSAPPKENAELWKPVDAAALAVEMGDFSLVTRVDDGRRQWAYKNRLLYTFRGDYSPTDLKGLNASKDARPALVARNFMPDSVRIEFVPTRGPIMMTQEGLTLYTQLGYRLQYGGRLSRDGYRYAYADAKHVGTRGCVDACTDTWHPYVAPPDAQASGPWEIETRPDGTRQWSYKGAPLYTYAGDKQQGDLNGNNRYVVVYGDVEGKVDLSLTTGGDDPEDSDNRAGSSFYWRTAALVN